LKFGSFCEVIRPVERPGDRASTSNALKLQGSTEDQRPPGIQRILISDNNTIHGTLDLVFIGPEIVSLHCLVFRILWICSITLCDVHLTSVIQERYFDLLLSKHTEGNKTGD